MKPILLSVALFLIFHGKSPAADAIPKLTPEESKAISEAKVRATLELIDGSNLRTPANIFGSAIVSILTADAEYLAKRPTPIKGVADTVIPTLLAHGPLIDLREHCTTIRGISLVAFDLLSGESFSFVYIAVGVRGPVAIKVDAFIAPDKQMNLSDIFVVEAWPDIKDLLAAHRRLPAQLNIFTPKKKLD